MLSVAQGSLSLAPYRSFRNLQALAGPWCRQFRSGAYNSDGFCEFMMKAITKFIANATPLQLYPGIGEGGPSGIFLIIHEIHVGSFKSMSAQYLAEKFSSLLADLVDRRVIQPRVFCSVAL